jgi:preprotein translocase subunit SecG
MNWVGILLLVIHIIACGGLILIVLLQAGKGASLGAAFGGGSSQTLFGAQSATFIGKATWVLAVAFMCTSLLLTMVSPWGGREAESGSSILQQEPIPSPPLGEESPAVAPETGSADEASTDAGGTMREDPMTVPLELPAEDAVQPEPETSESATDTLETTSDAPAAETEHQ